VSKKLYLGRHHDSKISKVLEQHLGISGMIRFLQQNEIGHGGYTQDRHALLGNPPLEQLVNDIQASNLNKSLLGLQ
jgi:hypothetical protein